MAHETCFACLVHPELVHVLLIEHECAFAAVHFPLQPAFAAASDARGSERACAPEAKRSIASALSSFFDRLRPVRRRTRGNGDLGLGDQFGHRAHQRQHMAHEVASEVAERAKTTPS